MAWMMGGKSWHESAVDGTATRVRSITHSSFHHPCTEGFPSKIRSSSIFQQLQNDTHKENHPQQTNPGESGGGVSFPF